MNAIEREELQETERLYLRTLGALYRRTREKKPETMKPYKMVFIYSHN